MSRRPRAIPFVASLLILFIACSADARTWWVRQDGSGDGSVLQDALDAAAPGDTIRIGPGRFDTFHERQSMATGRIDAAIAWVRTSGLTLIGDGNTRTLLGPNGFTEFVNGVRTRSIFVDASALDTRIEDLGVEHTELHIALHATTTMERCRSFRAQPDPYAWPVPVITVRAPDVVIRQCELVGPGGLKAGEFTSLLQGLSLEDCTFEESGAVGLRLAFASDVRVLRCSFRGGDIGIEINQSTGIAIESCVFRDQALAGLFTGSSEFSVHRSDIGLAAYGMQMLGGRIEVQDTWFRGGTNATIAGSATGTIRNSHILNAGGWSLRHSSNDPLLQMDARENWWGTTDTSLIASWIDDDDQRVLWQPILEQGVSASTSSIGGLKAAYLHRAVR